MDTCQFCGLDTPELTEHTRRAHDRHPSDIDAAVAASREKTADYLARHFRDAHAYSIVDLGTPGSDNWAEAPLGTDDDLRAGRQPTEPGGRPAMRPGGYL